jgi:CHAT domain-containing protein/predicted negative regulator of RcsB-dependent stress response
MSDAAAFRPDWVDTLSAATDTATRRELLKAQTASDPSAALKTMYDEMLRISRVDLDRAERVAEAIGWLAEDVNTDFARGQALRAKGHVVYLRGNHEAALEHYRAAIAKFEALGEEVEVARTIIAAVQSLAYAGMYDEAMTLAARARKTFEAAGDELRLARLDVNVANVLYRQDRFHESLTYYERARAYFLEHGNMLDVAITLRNMGVCYISLNNFDEALATYKQAHDFCLSHELPLLAAEADYNIAYLYYLRGEYTEAISLYNNTRAFCSKIDDNYHRALCDLDQAEMYLELNLNEEGAELAGRAYQEFKELKMGYEAAKATAFLAIAASQQAKLQKALTLFDRARELFVREANQLWPALIDLYKALVLFEHAHFGESRFFCQAALNFFVTSPARSKAVLCELLLARLDLKDGQVESAAGRCNRALEMLNTVESPALTFEADFVVGQVDEARGNKRAALDAYERAHSSLERLRSHLQGEELKVAFLKDKLAVFENTVALLLEGRHDAKKERSAFDCIERSKSRSLADMIAFRVHALTGKTEAVSDITARLRRVSEKVSWASKQARRAELQTEADAPKRVRQLNRKSREYQGEFSKIVGELNAEDRELASLLNAGTVPLEAIQEQIPADAMMVEYYEARGFIFAALVTRDSLRIHKIAQAHPVREHLRYLQFQLSKFRLGPEYLKLFDTALRAATREHLGAMYRALISPIRRKLEAEHLIIVPHGSLHYLPFHALELEKRALIDEFSISYAPSAAVYQLCGAKPPVTSGGSLVLGIPDPLAPYIQEEANSVAAVLPKSRLFMGEVATEQVLKNYAADSRYVHIATHGLFRQDNPMFSSIRLGQSELNLFDIYDLQLSAELVTLSGCGTGLNVVVGGDELLGLVRGLLYAGAQSLVVTLWDVNDESTAEFMKVFYQSLWSAPNKAVALRQAMTALRESHSHPYHWAPFLLIGKYL